ncbi:peptidase [Microbacterium sp.]|uniref:peptidase n=1 Tax=Microbacterium sp. TaxID=51671 RepID=UPI0025E58759|nr:peptidase [Microbacterium sp.]MBT9607785.1 peptidase [Microbacterium sp.]
MTIDWEAFLHVFLAALLGAAIVVTFYALGLRLLVRGGRPPLVAPAEFTDAITVISDKQKRRAEKAVAKAAARNPLSAGQKRLALVGAYVCFAVCAAAVLGALLLILLRH